MSAKDGRSIDGERFQVLVNAEEQHSLWPADLSAPKGWTPVGIADSKDVCLAYVDAHWTDMRPRSVREGARADFLTGDFAEIDAELTYSLEAVAEGTGDTQLCDPPPLAQTEPTPPSSYATDESFGDASSRTLPEVFEMRVRETPQAVALVFGERKISYAELDASANRLARYLADKRIGPGCLVAIALPRGFDMIVAMLGVLKAGAGYVPLDPDYPPRRLDFMLQDSGAIGPITNRQTNASVLGRDSLSPAAIVLDDPDLREHLALIPDDQLGDSDRTEPLLPGHLAYLMYTSGSTGTPKGVAVAHASVVNLALHPSYAEIGRDDVLLHAAPFSFDASVFEIWGALLNGARLALAPAGPTDLDQLAAAVDRHGVTIAWLTAGLFEQVTTSHLSMLGRLTHLLVGGDVVPTAAARRVLSQYPWLRLTNGYGPTETTTFACTHPIAMADVDAPSIPIGRQIENVVTYVLDASLWPARLRKMGELYVAGAGLAQGYFGRPGLTAERFLACPFGPPGSRMYRTGDIARRRDDGVLQFFGRADDQLKILGFRIEPGEIEAALLELPDIEQARVRPREIAGENRLVAYLVTRDGAAPPAASALRRALAERFPAYMVPASFVILDTLPLTANGKLDAAALPAPRIADGAGADREPLDANEALLCSLFAELSGADHVGPDDNFFELGGHSLVAVRLVARLRQVHGWDVPLRALFENPTPAGMARLLGQDAAAQTADGQVDGTGEIVPNQLLDVVIYGHRFVLRRLRAARAGEEFRGVLMCMPLLGGGAHYADIVTLSLHEGFEIWACSFDLQNRESPGSEAWIECAQSLVGWLQEPGALRPSAFLGFSVGGYVSWLVDSLLVAAGMPVTPIISLEGGALPAYYAHLRSRLAKLLPADNPKQRPRILLFHRSTLGALINPDRADDGWRQLGVDIDVVSCRTIRHLDFLDHRLLSAHGEIMSQFLLGGEITQGLPRNQPVIPTIGGKLFDLLACDPPPPSDDVRAVLRTLPDGPVDPEYRLAIMFLAMASGDAAFALEVAQRIVEGDPTDRNAHYVQVAVLAELGRTSEAVAIADSWCKRRGVDPVVRQRAKGRIWKDLTWEKRRWLFFSGSRMEMALDAGAACCGPEGDRRTAAQGIDGMADR